MAPHLSLAALANFGVRLHEAGDRASILRILTEAAREFRLTCFFGRVDPDSQGLEITWTSATRHSKSGLVDLDPPQTLLLLPSAPFMERVIHEQGPVYVKNLRSELAGVLPTETEAESELVRSLREPGSAICTPALAGGKLRGVLLVVGDALDDTMVTGVQGLADNLVVALENASVVQSLKKALLQEHAVVQGSLRIEDLAAQLTPQDDEGVLLRRVAEDGLVLIDCQYVAIYLSDPARGGWALSASAGRRELAEGPLAWLQHGANGGPLARSAEGGEVIVVRDTRADDTWSPFLRSTEAARLRSVWAAPLILTSDEILGAVGFFGVRRGGPDPAQLELSERYARQAARALAEARRRSREKSEARVEVLAQLGRSLPHELGQPLAVISGYAELISQGLLNQEQLRDACTELVSAAGALAEMVQQLDRITSYATKDYGPGRTVIDFARASAPEQPSGELSPPGQP